MEFIIDNQMWFIIGGVVLLMAFIGFIAEKTDFGRKEFEKKLKPVKEKKIKPEKVKEEKVIEEIMPIQTEELIPVQNDEVFEELFEEPTLEVIEEKEELSDSLDNNWGEVFPTETEEDLSVPLVVEEDLSESEVIEEDLMVPLEESDKVDNQEPVFEEEPTFEVIEEKEEPVFEEEILDIEPINIPEENKELEIELPEIESLNEDQEDDVWKF